MRCRMFLDFGVQALAGYLIAQEFEQDFFGSLCSSAFNNTIRRGFRSLASRRRTGGMPF